MSSTDVAIVGIGIHPFGRTEGVSGRDQGAFAARQALADAGVQWSDIQFAYGGSAAAGDAAYARGHYQAARELFEAVALDEPFAEFLTLPASERIDL